MEGAQLGAAERLIAPMVERFMAGDREFGKQRKRTYPIK
ncbi:DUF2274 domain-containing protein [Sphingopyxis sp. USTB-05]|nr:DUF2274 domain-containing protein [Sphingopyxis sp. USTB-05]